MTMLEQTPERVKKYFSDPKRRLRRFMNNSCRTNS